MSEELNPEIRSNLNRWIVGKMNTHKISMRKLGEGIEVGHSYISKILSGKQNAGFEFYLKIARYFDAIPEFLKVAGLLPDPDEEGVTFAELFAVIKQLTPKEREQVLNFALFVKEQTRVAESEVDSQTLATGET